MDPKVISNITRVNLEFQTRHTANGDHTTGPYWFGYYQLNGKTKRVYIGKELPKELELLLSTRVKPPGHRNYTWPGRSE